jgi:aspartate kinase
MSRLVQKFGGTSLADINKIRKAAEIAVEAAHAGNEVATVVSAMGHTTDHLISLAEQVTDNPSAREMDMLLTTGEQQSIALMTMAIQSLGYQARSFTGGQAGIITESNHGLAKIQEVNPDAVEATLARGEIAVVAGFQGVTANNELTTLGRGGSDTTAVALAGALNADRCDIFTDVDGVYTADPRMLSEARKLSAVSYEEMLELSATGAQVLAARSVELAMDTNVPLRVRSTFLPKDLGTFIGPRISVPEYTVCGIACDMNQVAVTLKSRVAEKATAQLDGISSLFTRLQELNILTDMVMLLAHEDEPSQEVAFTVDKRSIGRVQSLVESLSDSLSRPLVNLDSDIARISVVGRRLTTKPEIVASVFDALATGGIPVSMVSTGDIRVSVLLPAKYARDAVKLIHKRFGLEQDTFIA